MLEQNPSLLELDISNKVNPKVDVSIINTLVRSCRHLTVLKLSDYRVEDPNTLLFLCGKRVVQAEEISTMRTDSLRLTNGLSSSNNLADSSIDRSILYTGSNFICCSQDDSLTHMNGKATCVHSQCATNQIKQELPRLLTVEDCVEAPTITPHVVSVFKYCNGASGMASAQTQELVPEDVCDCEASGMNKSFEDLKLQPLLSSVDLVPSPSGACEVAGNDVEVSQEELVNQEVVNRVQEVQPGENADNGEDDLYEDDGPITLLDVEDHSNEYGCLNLVTLSLDNVNIIDPVAAILMQSLPRLRDLNLSDTDISNPWRFLDPLHTSHLIELEDLDIKSTALSRTALEMIPKFHPNLQKLSISSTTLPPHTYANIGRLTGVADLELIGGQFYRCDPEEIFDKGIAPAISGIGKHLQSLNLTYFAHVEFEVIIGSCPKLEHLDLSYTSTSVWFPCSSLGDCCPQLKTLNLQTCNIDAKEGSKDDPQFVSHTKALERMIGQPRNLEVLKLGGSAVSNDTLKYIFPNNVYPLRVLDLSRCKTVTIDGVEYVWKKCPFIRRIDLTYCKEITVNDSNSFTTKCFKERPLFKLEGQLIWK